MMRVLSSITFAGRGTDAFRNVMLAHLSFTQRAAKNILPEGAPMCQSA
jgi:hypothetical protein